MSTVTFSDGESVGAGAPIPGTASTVSLSVPASVAPDFSGDPRLILGPDGSRLQFTGGQPLLDKGLENLVMISLFTAPGWVGNRFMVTSIGSDFEDACNQPITRQSLNLIRQAAERALALTVLGKVTVVVTNPAGHRINVQVGSVCLTRNNGNWSFQATDPAYRKVIN